MNPRAEQGSGADARRAGPSPHRTGGHRTAGLPHLTTTAHLTPNRARVAVQHKTHWEEVLLPKPLLYAVVIVVTVVWAVAAIADITSNDYDAQGVHLIFGGIVGGLIGLARRENGGGD